MRTSRINNRALGSSVAHPLSPTDDAGFRTAAAKYLPLAALLFCSASLSANAQESAASLQALRFEGYPNAPEFSVLPRKKDLFFYPCDQCHESMEPNPEIRQLNAMHDSTLEHGRGRIWCTSCHDLENRNFLRTLLNELVDIDEAYLICGGCHANRHKDWSFGAHGKRVANWQGDRTLYNCTHCHNPHSPAIKARAPKPAPPVRAGLKLEPGIEREKSTIWDSQEERVKQ